MSRRRNRTYSKELKLTAVQAYLNGEGSYETLRKKYGIVNVTQLKRWVKWYNGHKECKERRGAGTEIYMAKGRKTTQEERGKIVAFCIAREGLSVDDPNIRGILPANICMGEEV